MAISEAIHSGAPAPSSPVPDGAVTVRLDRENAGRLSRTLADLLSNEAVAAVVTPVGLDETATLTATLTVTLAQLRRQLRDL